MVFRRVKGPIRKAKTPGEKLTKGSWLVRHYKGRDNQAKEFLDEIIYKNHCRDNGYDGVKEYHTSERNMFSPSNYTLELICYKYTDELIYGRLNYFCLYYSDNCELIE